MGYTEQSAAIREEERKAGCRLTIIDKQHERYGEEVRVVGGGFCGHLIVYCVCDDTSAKFAIDVDQLA
jgi:hypothetical protein